MLLCAGLIGSAGLYILAVGQRSLISGAVRLLLHKGEVVVELLRALCAAFCKGGCGGQGHQAGKHQGGEFHGSIPIKSERCLIAP